MRISSYAVERPVTMLMLLCCVTVLGIIAMIRIPVNSEPEVERPILSVHAYLGSSSPEEIQKQITIPLEDVLSTTSNLDELTSWSSQSSSRVIMRFLSGTDMDITFLEVRDKIDQIMKNLPEDLRRIYIRRYEPNDEPVVESQLTWDGPDYELYELVFTRLYNRLRRVPGVADVDIRGLSHREVMVNLEQNRLQAHGVDIYTLSRGISSNNNNVSGGNVRSAGRKYTVRAIGEYQNMDEIRNTRVPGTDLRLSDLGDVEYGEPYHHWWTRLNGRDAISLAVYRNSTANMIDVARRVRNVLEEFQQEEGMEPLTFRIYRDMSLEIQRSLEGLIRAGLLGMLFACIVLYLFLRKIRSTLLILTAIPISMITTFLIMYLAREFMGSLVTINLVSLTGMMISVGMLLDNGVVVLENIFRHRQEYHEDPRKAAIDGAGEVALPVIAATATTLIVFVPMFFMGSSWMGTTMTDFGIVVCVALLASLCVAFTLIPMLSSHLFHSVRQEQISALSWLTGYYRRIVGFTLRHRVWTVAVALVCMGSSVWLFDSVERELQPREPRRNVVLRVEHPTQYSDEELLGLFGSIEDSLLSRVDELDIESVGTQFGRPWSSSGKSRSSSYVRIRLKELEDSWNQDTFQALENVMAVLPERPGVVYRRGYSRSSKGEAQVVEMELHGHDINLMALYAEELKLRLAEIRGVVNVETSLETGREEVNLHVNRDKAQKLGLTSRQVAQSLSAALSTRAASYYRTSYGQSRITVRLQEEDRVALSELENMVMENRQGEMISLASVADHNIAKGPLSIERENRRTVVEIYVTTEKAGRRWLQEAIYKQLQTFHLPIGYSWDMGRSFRMQEEMEQETLFTAMLALFLIYMVLAALFESFIHPFTIVLSIPFAMIGALLMFIITGTTLNSMSYLGLIILMGIVVNNGIILISYIIRLRESGMSRNDAIIQGGVTRLRPILMTASTTILGISPLVLPMIIPSILPPADGSAGTYGPIAAGVMGGMVSSTILTLFITPTLYSLFEDLWEWLHRVMRALIR